MKRTIHPKPASVLEWESHHQHCFLCNAWGPRGLDTHHVQRRGTSFKPYQDHVENLMRLCRFNCHAEVESWPAARQLALKWQHDKAGHADLQSFVTAWLLIYDPPLVAPNRVTPAEVEAFLPPIDPRTAHLPPLPR